MTDERHTIQDRRVHSRLPVLLSCEFTWDSVAYQALVMDLSPRGAFLASHCIPPNRCPIRVTIRSPQLKRTVTVDGSVVRGGWFLPHQSKSGGFGVRFSRVSPPLLLVLRELVEAADGLTPEAAAPQP